MIINHIKHSPQLLCKLCRTFTPPPSQQWGSDLPFLGQAGHADPQDGWRCSSQKRMMSRLIQISIRCNRIEHWVHPRCAGIRQTQYTDTWTCHLHRESRLTPQTDITPQFQRSQPTRGGTVWQLQMPANRDQLLS